MHSKIIQLETHPVDISLRIGPEDFSDHWFLDNVADYVTEDDNRSDTIETLVCVLNAGAHHLETFSDGRGEGIILHEGLKQAYLGQRFRDFDMALRTLAAKATAEAFCEDKLGLEMYQLEEIYHAKYGYYIQSDDGLLTLTDFVRTSRPETKYYFGGTVDYHF